MNVEDIYIEPAGSGKFELKERRSRFIANVAVARCEEDARAYVREMSRLYADARHNCWAYRVGYPETEEYSSDDGEPSGSAGKPILGAILHGGLTNTVIVVTRYFGGVKLGVRGLIEAYEGAARGALNRAGEIQRQLTRSVLVEVTYDGLRQLVYRLKILGVDEEHMAMEYGMNVVLTASIPMSVMADAATQFDGYVCRGQILSWKWNR